jgi:hypothetical protein
MSHDPQRVMGHVSTSEITSEVRYGLKPMKEPS